MQLILTNGMPRSGSTWLYNAVRHILSQVTEPRYFTYGWHEDIGYRNRVNLIKAHGINHDLLNEASQIFYSYRDIRDVLASRMRMWKMAPTLDYARDLIIECQFFEQAANYVMRYEDFLVDPRKTVDDIIIHLGVIGVNADTIIDALDADKKPASHGKPYNKEELYHVGHVTNGSHMSFADDVPADLIKNLEDSFGDWFVSHGYQLVS